MSHSICCPWCWNLCTNLGDAPMWCPRCMHRAEVPKELCDCLMCLKPISFEGATVDLIPDLLPVPPAPDVAEYPDDQIGSLGPMAPSYNRIHVEGRGLSNPCITAKVFLDHVQIRVDDLDNPETWFVVTVTGGLMGAWVRSQGMAEDRDDASANFE